jgi:HAD superfamily hydrolase (TIGR01509 family)
MSDRPVLAVVFDMDGTLIDSLPVVLDRYRQTVEDLGGPSMTPDDILASFSIGRASLMLETLIGRPGVGAEAVAVYERHLGAALEGIRAYPGIADTLRSLSAAVPVGVFTAADTAAAELLLGATGLREWLGPVIGADRVPRSKPSPDGLLAVCSSLEVPPARVAYVGDGAADVLAARACGAVAVAVTWGHGYRDDRDADVTVDTPGELLELVGTPRVTAGGAR